MSSSSSSRNLPKENNPLSRPSVSKTRAPLGDVVNRRNPLGDITNQKNGSRISAPSSTLASKPPKLNAKSNVRVPYEDIESPQRKAESDLGGNDDDEVDDIDSNLVDPQLCGAFACDIYEHLRSSEVKKRPAFDYMESVQSNINASMRTILIDWLVEVAEEYRLLPETLYLAVNCLDRYLSGNVITKQNLQLLGVSCMMIAAKYEEVCVPQVESFCYITDNTYSRNELLEMESSVLNYLKRFVRAAKGKTEVPLLLFESLASYLSELSLLDYAMLRYAPSLVAASAVFLARYILHPSRKPWLCHESPSADIVAVRKKYSQDKYKFAAKKFCPTSLPQELFL
ncbi:BnaC02g13720D [Brassica napus]|uniref:BnaC02g13720D protein n=1 Tax=Brassica napus TaxID=3708 RepID=A0A078HWL5_BRANA|nr:BnaC02g13720D [Brassica napus]